MKRMSTIIENDREFDEDCQMWNRPRIAMNPIPRTRARARDSGASH